MGCIEKERLPEVLMLNNIENHPPLTVEISQTRSPRGLLFSGLPNDEDQPNFEAGLHNQVGRSLPG